VKYQRSEEDIRTKSGKILFFPKVWKRNY